MTESTTRKRIAAMWGEINGVRTAFTQIPRRLQDAQLPASVVFPGQATHNYGPASDDTEEFIKETRTYKMILYISNAQLGTSGQGEIDADPFFDDVLRHFSARPGLELNSEGAQQSESVLNAALLTDGGLQVGPYPLGGGGAEPSPDYIQIGWDLQVVELIEVNYQD